jgi:hypothetical protein
MLCISSFGICISVSVSLTCKFAFQIQKLHVFCCYKLAHRLQLTIALLLTKYVTTLCEACEGQQDEAAHLCELWMLNIASVNHHEAV